MPEFLFQPEHLIDDAGNLIRSTYVDFRTPDARLPITTLIRGCPKEYAIEHKRTVRIRKPAYFRDHGKRLIRDRDEARISRESSTTRIDDPQDLRAAWLDNSDMNRATELVDSTARIRTTGTEYTFASRHSVAYGKNGWTFSTSIEPENQDQFRLWKETLEDHYDHVSYIYRPREFARALGLMVAEQLGPQDREATLTHRLQDHGDVRTKLSAQTIFHGPMIYAVDPYEIVGGAGSPLEQILLPLFVKGMRHRDQREYRFSIWSETESAECTVDLRASGALLDSMRELHALPEGAPPSTGRKEPGHSRPERASMATSGIGQKSRAADSDRLSNLSPKREKGRDTRSWDRDHRLDGLLAIAGVEKITVSYSSAESLRSSLYEYNNERRVEIASAAFFVEPYLRYLISAFEDPIGRISVTADNFVVLQMKFPTESQATGRIAVGPRGKGSYKIKTDDRESGGFIGDTGHPTSGFQRALQEAGLRPLEPRP